MEFEDVHLDILNQLEKVFDFDPYRLYENQISNKSLHFVSIMLRRKHTKAKRKVASFGLALGSKYKIVENFK